ncbi:MULTISPECIES: PepSY-associated TM helix domain-containing protein [Catenuloplanes]|uniref:Iron-regulated membrane protein n=1 Tax=Catenuloplanes niger TaxID=587534 RepID=A0AAE4A1Z8_9ACTN|nr:PepSY domain-containing protein [Catenuloplanes niger]MDR7327765.1 putative iron-regulated membrane protein [Catenuloplanes niger]
MSVTPEVAAPAPAAAPVPRRVNGGSALGALLLRVHFYAGLMIAPFLVVAAVTGLLFVATPTLDRLLYAQELLVDDASGATVPVSQQLAAARAAHPEGTITGVRVKGGEWTTHVDFAVPELAAAEKVHTVYVDPYTGAVTGQLTTQFGWTPPQAWLDVLHRDLHLGAAGNLYSELAASWLWVIALGGIVLWWRRRRTVRGLLAPELSARRGVRRTRGWHGAVGAWLLVGLLGLSATGLTWSNYAGAHFGLLIDQIRGGTPSVSTALTGAPGAAAGGHHGGGTAPATGADPAGIDTALTVARDNGLDGPVSIVPPADANTAWKVSQTDTQVPERLDSVAVDTTTGTVTDRVDFADWPFTAKLTNWGINAHMGLLFGAVNQIVLAALAIGLLCVIVWGYRMWWQRRPTRDGRRALVGAAPARVDWRAVPARAVVAGILAVFAVGWALPLFGIPLAAFVVIDAIVATVRDRRGDRRGARPETPVSPAPAGG